MKLNYKIEEPFDFVFEQLSDAGKFVTVHPVISRMEDLGHEYRVYETLKFGIPVSFTYYASITADREARRVVMKARVMKVNKIEMIFHLTDKGTYTIVNEEINFKTIWPLPYFLGKIFQKQHAQLFRNIALVRAGSVTR